MGTLGERAISYLRAFAGVLDDNYLPSSVHFDTLNASPLPLGELLEQYNLIIMSADIVGGIVSRTRQENMQCK